jgi:hypothetical protein
MEWEEYREKYKKLAMLVLAYEGKSIFRIVILPKYYQNNYKLLRKNPIFRGAFFITRFSIPKVDSEGIGSDSGIGTNRFRFPKMSKESPRNRNRNRPSLVQPIYMLRPKVEIGQNR